MCLLTYHRCNFLWSFHIFPSSTDNNTSGILRFFNIFVLHTHHLRCFILLQLDFFIPYRYSHHCKSLSHLSTISSQSHICIYPVNIINTFSSYFYLIKSRFYPYILTMPHGNSLAFHCYIIPLKTSLTRIPSRNSIPLTWTQTLKPATRLPVRRRSPFCKLGLRTGVHLFVVSLCLFWSYVWCKCHETRAGTISRCDVLSVFSCSSGLHAFSPYCMQIIIFTGTLVCFFLMIFQCHLNDDLREIVSTTTEKKR